MNKESGQAGLAVCFITLVVVMWVAVGVLFFLNRESNIPHYTSTTICSAHYSAADDEYYIHTADTGDYHIDLLFNDQKASALFHKINRHLPGTYAIKWYSNWTNGSQGLNQANLLPASAQQHLCLTKK